MGLFDGFRRNRANRTMPVSAPAESKPVEKRESASENKQLDTHMADEQQDVANGAAIDATEAASVEDVANAARESESSDAAPIASEEAIGADGEAEELASDEEPAEPEPQGVSLVKNTPIKTLADKQPVTHVVGETKIMAIINQKGGVGKSTTAINLSAALGEADKAVLVIDLDPQGNTTSGLGVDKGKVEHDIYEVLLSDLPIEQAIIPDVCKGLDLVPATINLAGAEVELVNEMARENRLKAAVGALRGKYDYIFIDCPPALGLLTVNALVASDKLLIPIQCEYYALEGVTKLLDSMKRVKTALNPSLDIFGVVLTMYDSRTMLAKQVALEVRNFFEDKVFDAVIPRTVRLSEAPSFGQPITEYDPKGRGAEAYVNLAKEVIQRG